MVDDQKVWVKVGVVLDLIGKISDAVGDQFSYSLHLSDSNREAREFMFSRNSGILLFCKNNRTMNIYAHPCNVLLRIHVIIIETQNYS